MSANTILSKLKGYLEVLVLMSVLLTFTTGIFWWLIDTKLAPITYQLSTLQATLMINDHWKETTNNSINGLNTRVTVLESKHLSMYNMSRTFAGPRKNHLED